MYVLEKRQTKQPNYFAPHLKKIYILCLLLLELSAPGERRLRSLRHVGNIQIRGRRQDRRSGEQRRRLRRHNLLQLRLLRQLVPEEQIRNPDASCFVAAERIQRRVRPQIEKLEAKVAPLQQNGESENYLARLIVDVVEGGDGDAEVDVGSIAVVRGQHVDVVVGDRVKGLRFLVAIHMTAAERIEY
jgi:hypothetical protein